jgi:ABC-type multidrug transport system fused ATPase/permease subunit
MDLRLVRAGNSEVIIVAHRLETVRVCDMIVRLGHGRVVGRAADLASATAAGGVSGSGTSDAGRTVGSAP